MARSHWLKFLRQRHVAPVRKWLTWLPHCWISRCKWSNCKAYGWKRSAPGDRLNIKMPSYQCRDSHYGGKAAPRPSYIYYVDPYTLNAVLLLKRALSRTKSEPCPYFCVRRNVSNARLYVNMIVALYVAVVLRGRDRSFGAMLWIHHGFRFTGGKSISKKTPLCSILVMIINNVARTRRIEIEARLPFRVIDMYSISHEYEHNALVLLSDCCYIITSYWSMCITFTFIFGLLQWH